MEENHPSKNAQDVPSRLEVGEPAAHSTSPAGPQAKPGIGRMLKTFLRREPVAAAGGGTVVPRVAVIVTHGMGQQVKFQTLDQIERGLRRAEAQRTGVPLDQQPRSVARAAKLGDLTQERLEMTLTGAGGVQAEVHLYECYWAPLTQGRVGLRDVMSFLWRGGYNGIRNSGERFWRWMFGGKVVFEAQPQARRALLLAWGVLATLVLFNAVTAAAAAALVAGHGTSQWLSAPALMDLTCTLLTWMGAVAVCAVLAVRTRNMRWFDTALAFTLAAGVATLFLLGWHALKLGQVWPVPLGREPSPLQYGLFFGFWGLLAFASAKIRSLLIEYLGDVAAYISPHYLDRFNDIRTDIKKCTWQVASSVYGARTVGGAEFVYDHIVMVGHSLGSVVTYDTLNALINRDLLDGARDQVAQRTALLLTFGSPLDKTAFVFATQSSDTTEAREALAAVVQPLIQSYDYRSFPWVNVYSPQDIVSGPLDYYDDPRHPDYAAKRVLNLVDEKADVPLLAHVQYWDNDLVFERLHQAVTAQVRVAHAS